MDWLIARLAPLCSRTFCERAGARLIAKPDARARHKGLALLARAAKRGDAAAALRLGQIYLAGQLLPPSRGQAAHWLHRAAEAGHAPAQLAYAQFLWSSPPLSTQTDPLHPALPAAPMERDAEGAKLWAGRAAEAGLAEAEALLAQILCFGPDALRDEARGEALYEAAAAAGRAEAKLGLALLLYRRAGKAAAMEPRLRLLFEEAAAGGAVYAFHALGILDEEAGDWAAALAHHREAAQRGHGVAQRRLGLLLLEGLGAPADALAGETWLRRAALGGDTEAAFQLGLLQAETRSGLPPNQVEATAWFRRAAESGHLLAQYRLGRILLAEDMPAEARHWIGEAAGQGLAAAQAILGEMTLHGRGGPADAAAALHLFESAAAQNHLGAIFALGILLAGASGLPPGLPQDRPRALDLLRQAAAHGHPAARDALAQLTAEGSPHPP